VLVPLLLVLIYVGAFAEKHAVQDLLVVLLFGALGWVMVELRWPRPPLILGLVLGPLAENRLYLATGNYGAAWLRRPWVLLLIALTLAGALYPAWRRRDPGRSPASGDTRGGNRWRWLLDLALVAVGAWALWESRRFGLRAGLFPWVIGVTVLGLAIVQLGLDLAARGEGPTPPGLAPAPSPAVAHRTAGILGWIVGYPVAMWFFGFALGGALCALLQLRIGGREPWPLALALSGAAWAVVHGLFERILHLPFPPGQLWLWLDAG
jgi:hypothetical protein